MQFIEKKPLVVHFNECARESVHDEFEAGYVTAMQNAAEYVEDQPVEDVEIILRGEWHGINEVMIDTFDELSVISGQCSICGKEVSRFGDTHAKYLYDRCPHCGAIMKENYEREFWTDRNDASQNQNAQIPAYNLPETNNMFNYD